MTEQIKEQIKKLVDKMTEKLYSYENYLYRFDGHSHKFRPFRENSSAKPRVPGIYLTIRVGFMGIYTMANEWKDDKWQIAVLDGSHTIAYSPDKLKDIEDISEEIKKLEG